MNTTTLQAKLKLLDLSNKEEKVLMALKDGYGTPLRIMEVTKVSRPAVYDIFKKLKKRGLVESKITHGKKHWHMVSERELADTLYETKKVLLGLHDGSQEVVGVSDGVVVVHTGKEAVKKVLFEMFRSHKSERFLGTANMEAVNGWLNILTPEEINETNRIIKKNSLITEVIGPHDSLEKHFKVSGVEWAKDYEGRTASTVYVDKKYFNHAGQIFAFKDSLYLLALNDQMIIEIRHSDIQKMILSMYAFMKDRGEIIDANRVLRTLMGEQESV
jgi:sugar-specific transcriptional regulator TrmB